jgi:MFS family permease
LFATVADQRPPKVLLIAGYAAQGLGCAVVAAAIVVDASPYVVYAGAVWASVAMTTTRPAQAALVPGLVRDVEELTATNLLIGWVENVAIVVAGVVSGLLISVGGVAEVAAVSAFLVVLALLLVVGLPAARLGEGEASRSAVRQVARAVSAVLNERRARLLVALLGVEWVVIGALDVLFVVLAVDVLNHGEGWAGYLNSAHGAGGVAILVLAPLVIGRRLGPVIVASACLLGLALAATALVSQDYAVLGLLCLVGASRSLFDIATRSLLQRAVAADMVARVFGIVEGLNLGAAAVGSVLVPVLVAFGDGAERLALFVVAAVVPCAVLLRIRTLSRIDQQAQVPVVEISLLRSTPAFRSLPSPELEGVARALQRVSFDRGAEIIRQGDDGAHYYAIADGKVDIHQDGQRIGELGRGSGMGEIALLQGGPRTATAVAATPVTAYALDRNSFLATVAGHVPTQRDVNDIARQIRDRDRQRQENQRQSPH